MHRERLRDRDDMENATLITSNNLLFSLLFLFPVFTFMHVVDIKGKWLLSKRWKRMVKFELKADLKWSFTLLLIVGLNEVPFVPHFFKTQRVKDRGKKEGVGDRRHHWILTTFKHCNIPSLHMAQKKSIISTIVILLSFVASLCNAAGCIHPVYCTGPLLDTVQRAKIFNDSKTFVDMPMKYLYSIFLSLFSLLFKYRDISTSTHFNTLKHFDILLHYPQHKYWPYFIKLSPILLPVMIYYVLWKNTSTLQAQI